MNDSNSKSVYWIDSFRETLELGLGDWEIESKTLGQGGFGATFLGRLPMHFPRRDIYVKAAIKVLNPSNLKFADLISSFESEVECLTRVDSRFVAQLVDAGITSDGLAWLATDFVDGVSLAHRLEKNGPLVLTDWVVLAEHSLRGLAAAHEKGVAHLDLKPANIMCSQSDDSFVLIDFGLAKVQTRISQIHPKVFGTVTYLAPEAFDHQYSKQSDIFSLGTTLYTALTGINPWVEAIVNCNIPFESRSDAYRWALENSEPDWKSIPSEVFPLLKSMMELDPKKRPDPRNLIRDLIRLRISETTKLSEIQNASPTGHKELFQSWREFEQEVLHTVDLRGIANLKLDIHTDNQLEVWFRGKNFDTEYLLTCPAPQRPSALLGLGWKPVKNTPHLYKTFRQPASSKQLVHEIVQALESGYGANILTLKIA